MILKFLKNNNSYDLDEGVVLTQNFNETLDSANCSISNLSSEIDIEPYDKVLLDGKYYMCVDTPYMTQLNVVTNHKHYSYEISLFSETKLLEGKILPNLSITKLRNSVPRTIKYYLEQYLNEYKGNETWSYGDLTKFEVECPEFQWNMPTLREVINDLMMVVDCIAVMQNGVINYIDITKKNNLITDYNYIKKSQSSSDYVSEIQTTLQNVMQTEKENVKTSVLTTEFLPLVSNSNVVNSENCMLRTQYPILNIKHLWMCMVVNENAVGTGRRHFYKIDLCNLKILAHNGDEESSLVKEKAEYDTLLSLYRTSLGHEIGYDNIINRSAKNTFSKYKNFCLYYTRNSREIRGFNTKTRDINLVFDCLQWLRCILVTNMDDDPNVETPLLDYAKSNVQSEGETKSYYDQFFQIEYETTASCMYRASKSDKKNNKVIIDNQTNSWVDAYQQGNLTYQKANRLGNENCIINNRYQNCFKALTNGTYYINGELKFNIVNLSTNGIHSFNFSSNYYDFVRIKIDANKMYYVKSDNTEVLVNNNGTWVNNNYKNISIPNWQSITNNAYLFLFNNAKEKGKIELADYLDDYIVYQVQYQIYSNHIEVNAYAVKNYIMKNYFTGIQSKVRTWVNAQNEAFERHDLKKYYCEMSFSNDSSATHWRYWMSSVDSSRPAYDPIRYVVVTTYAWDGVGYNTNLTNGRLSINCIGRIVGNSIIFTAGFDDNWTMGRYVNQNLVTISNIDSNYGYLYLDLNSITENDEEIGGVPLSYISYVDINGEYERVKLEFCDSMSMVDGNFTNPTQGALIDNANAKSFFIYMYKKPYVSGAAYIPNFTTDLILHKDNREIPMISTQYEFLTDTRNITFTKKFIEYQQSIRNITLPSFKVYLGGEYYFGIQNKPSGAVLNNNVTLSVDEDGTLTISLSTGFANRPIFICDNDDNLILACVSNNTTQVNIYMNIKEYR